MKKLGEKKLTYFIAICTKDDSKLENTEFDLIQCLTGNFYLTKDENEYQERIKKMIAQNDE